VAALALGPGAIGRAHAAGPRLVLDRVDAEPSAFGSLARLRLHVTAVQLEGAVIDVPSGESIQLTINGSRRREPHLVGRYAQSGGSTAVLIVVETGWEMERDIEELTAAARQLVAGLPSGSTVGVVSYGEHVDGGHRLGTPAAAEAQLGRLDADPAPADPQLLAAIERSISTLSRARAEPPELPLRRLILVLSDGKDVDPEPSRYRSIGERANREGIRIHSLAYSPVDNRRPLVGLGELSKRSSGTFRWVRSSEGLPSQVATLLDEINRQYVLTWFLPPDQVVGKRLAVSYLDLTSNQVRVKRVVCGGSSCEGGALCVRARCVALPGSRRRGLLGWLLVIGGGLVGLALLAAVIGAAMGRARSGPRATARPRPGGPPLPGVPPAMAGMPGPLLWIIAGPFQGQRMMLRHGFVIGSARDCDLFLPDPQVAPQHALFIADPAGGYQLFDRSGQGVFVNGARVFEARLQHGNVVRVGTCELRYLLQ
jgi:hypothetical protein